MKKKKVAVDICAKKQAKKRVVKRLRKLGLTYSEIGIELKKLGIIPNG